MRNEGLKMTGLRRPRFWCGWLVLAASLAAIAILGSCAYFNIYWMAAQDYEKATAGTSAAEFWDPFGQQPLTSDKLKDIDSCAKRCGKILLLYPKSKWVDDALVLMGNCFVLKGDYANAIRKYEELLKFYPNSERADEAKFMSAYTRVLYGSTEEALAALQDLQDEIKSKRWQEHVVFLAGRIYLKNADCDGAIDYYQTYLKSFPGGQKAVDVTLALADCLIKVGRQSEVAKLLEPLAKKQDLAGSMAAIKLGRAYRKLGQDDKALDIFRNLADKALLDSIRARSDIEIAMTLEAQDKPEDAITTLSLADSLGKVSLGGEARYRIGLIYEQRLGDFVKATAAYDSASKASSTFSKLASRRGTALKAAAKYEQALNDSTIKDVGKQAQNRFLLGETYLIDLGLTARAEKEFRVLSDSLPPGAYTARAKLELGSLLDARGDSTAKAYYQAVIDSFPTTVYANMARSHLGLPLVDVPAPVAAPPADTTKTTAAGGPPGAQGVTEMGPQPEGSGPPGAQGATEMGPQPEAGEAPGAGHPPSPGSAIGPQPEFGVQGTPPDTSIARKPAAGPTVRDSLGLPSDTTGVPSESLRVAPESTFVPPDTTGRSGTDTGER